MSKPMTTEVFLEKVWTINQSYKERYCYSLCQYTGSFNKITLTCKKHNAIFEVLACNHIANAKNEIKQNISKGGGCKECYSEIRKENAYKNIDKNLPENYNDVDWKVITDFDSYYINNKGDIWSKLSRKFIKSHQNDSGYLVVSLYKKSESKNYMKRVHILVAESFVINHNPELYDIVNHIDGNRANPLYSNLEWTNKSQNAKHAHAIGNANRNNQRNEITILDLNDNVIQSFYSQTDLCKYLEVTNYLVTNYFNGFHPEGSEEKLNTLLTKKKWKLERKLHRPIVDLKKYDTDDENWKEILPDYPNYYISNFGNVKKMGKLSEIAEANGFISPSSNSEGDHLSVGLRNGNFKRIHVHYLVLKYHLVCKYDTTNMIIDHKDCNKQNNYIGNLEWVDYHINSQRSMINGCWNRKDRKQKVSHVDYCKYGSQYKYRTAMKICGKSVSRYADTFGEAIQNKKELYAIMIISNYIKFKKGLYPKYYMLNINFQSITNEVNLHN